MRIALCHLPPNQSMHGDMFFFLFFTVNRPADDENKTKQNKITVNKPTDDQNKNNIEQNKKKSPSTASIKNKIHILVFLSHPSQPKYR